MYPEAFLDCSAEKKLAGYLGFVSTPELHICAVSWPFLRATVAIQPIFHNLYMIREALVLIRDTRRIGDLATIDGNWSLVTSDEKSHSFARVAEHLAIVLINLKSDLAVMTATSDEQNQLQHHVDGHMFNLTYPTHVCPLISYPIRPPILSPLDGESFLDPYNRCLLLLRHMRNIMRSGVFDSRYENDQFKFGLPVTDEFKPAWMRSVVPPTTPSVPEHEHYVTAPNSPVPCVSEQPAAAFKYSAIYSIETRPRCPLTARPTLQNHTPSPDQPATITAPMPKSFAIIWDHDLETEYTRSTIKRAMCRAQSKDVDPPSELQKLNKDPRQMTEEPLLYEQIRIQFRCHFLGLDLSKLLLQYTTSAFGESVTVKQNLQDECWSDTQAALSDPANDNFLFRVGFFGVESEWQNRVY